GGLRRGDVITSIDGEPVRDGNVLRNHVAGLQPGTRVELQVLRGGKPQTLTLTLGELAPARGPSDDADQPAQPDGTGFGMSVQPLTKEQARQLQLDATSGVVVMDVQASGRAADAGLRRGDVITEVDGKAVDTVDTLRSLLKAGNRPALLLVHRDGATLYLTLDRDAR
ncbi:MAG TPA: PDZ domain-containing protein, partial [Vicinamibacterales bacterium]|nr:PDZ domain-containing protein [Vicinamibacterales bacterium]